MIRTVFKLKSQPIRHWTAFNVPKLWKRDASTAFQNSSQQDSNPFRQRPSDPCYFTGNSKYYNYIFQLNYFIRKFDIDFKAPTMSTVNWKSISALQNEMDLKLNEDNYNDFVHRLNLLYPVIEQDAELKTFLQQFVPIGKSLDVTPVTILELDEFQRSYTTGSRKTSRSQVWITKGTGQIYVNGNNLIEHFNDMADRRKILLPFEATNTLGKYNVWCIVQGGGKSGHADAIKVAIARGLVIHDETTRKILSDLNLTRIDVRQVERKKTGQPKARKKNTWVKR
ncbi:ribosomal protein S5 domain 2-type protein [Globomyces pollinis-pini]|nr:ribosomal protein S5 domain 2-type protein [Globomyces pollinis-pini]